MIKTQPQQFGGGVTGLVYLLCKTDPGQTGITRDCGRPIGARIESRINYGFNGLDRCFCSKGSPHLV